LRGVAGSGGDGSVVATGAASGAPAAVLAGALSETLAGALSGSRAGTPSGPLASGTSAPGPSAGGAVTSIGNAGGSSGGAAGAVALASGSAGAGSGAACSRPHASGAAGGGTSFWVGSSAVYVYVSLGRYSYSGRGARRHAAVPTNIVAVITVATHHHIPTLPLSDSARAPQLGPRALSPPPAISYKADMLDLVMAGPGKNAMSGTLMEGLLTSLRAAGDQPILLRGDGDAFSAGLDLKEVVSLDPPAMAHFLGTLEALVEALFLHPGPTVACVNGHAIAGGCVLALCCDHRVVATGERIRIGLNEVAVGASFPPRALAASTARVPRRHLEEVILGAGLHTPATAQRLGLVDEIAADPAAVARTHLERLAALPRAAYTDAKTALRAPLMAAARADQARLDAVVTIWSSPAVKDRLRAALGSRG
jgi:enoyl-CoA hydratase/carnithine racemase